MRHKQNDIDRDILKGTDSRAETDRVAVFSYKLGHLAQRQPKIKAHARESDVRGRR